MIYKLSELQKIARENRFAIPHVLGGNLEMTYGAIKAAQEMESPLALGFAPEVFASLPMAMVMPAIMNAAREANIPIAVQLEHGKSYEQAAEAISLGAISVMYDGSDLTYEDNVSNTAEVVRMAHAFGACVEAELGHVGGSAVRGTSNTSLGKKTDPDLVVDFVKRTGVDTLAVSFGNVHGHYQGPVDIDTDLVRMITKVTDVPLVMHGGSGLPDEVYRGIVEAGISNIHFYSGVVKDIWSELKRKVGPEDLFPPFHEIVSYNIDFFEEKTKKIIQLLGSENMIKCFSY
ncbi:MAG: class II fructose-bisphosphate aldolase [Lachnospiraceae bacterium]|nr:class II fructose-bisphosphate aldolase [Lachnospiraceae bacterium]